MNAQDGFPGEGTPVDGAAVDALHATEREAAQRAEIEALLHTSQMGDAPVVPGTVSAFGHEDPRSSGDGPAIQVSTGGQAQTSSPASFDPVEATIWSKLLDAEDARWMRYQRPCVALHLEVVGGSEVAARLGIHAADRIRAQFDALLKDETRASDRFSRPSPWHAVAMLPETEPEGARVAVERLSQTFQRRLGPTLALWIAAGMAAPPPAGDLRTAFHMADQALRVEVRQSRQARRSPVEPDPTAALAGARASLAALGQLLEDGSISRDEYQAKRAAILDRL